MSEFTTKVAPLKNSDPFKRVAYPPGMLLTPAEFLQEQYYFLERNRLHHRLLHGYGTVCGLNVSVQDNDKISVSEGIAVDTRGRMIRVEHAQCASLKEWLKKNSDKPPQTSPPAPPPDSLYVVLCYRDCPSDKVLIRTSPCQPKEQSEAYSRLQESFDLKLATDPPVQIEEETIRAFGDLFAELRVSSGLTRLNEAELQAAITKIRSLVLDLCPDESPPVVSSPPDSWMQALHPADAEILFRHAFKVWVTEVKPNLLPDRTCSGSSDEDACVLLAELSVNVNPTTWQIEGDVTVNEAERPVYISTRLLQECVLNRPQGEALGGVTAHSALSGLTTGDDHLQYHNDTRGDARYALMSHTHFLDNLSDVDVSSPGDDQVLTWDSGSNRWIAQTPSVGVSEHSALSGLGGDDHLQYLLTDGTRALTGDLSAGNNKITNLATATIGADALSLGQFNALLSQHFLRDDHSQYLLADGTRALNGNLKANDNKITNLKDATAPKDALNLQSAQKRFVEGVAGPYRLVAAGRFNEEGKEHKPIYGNELTVKQIEVGTFALHFKGYAPPDDKTHSYVVKGTTEGKTGGLFHVIEFSKENIGIIIRSVFFKDPGSPIALGFMVEISEILVK